MESDSRREKGEEKPVYGLRFNLFGVWYGMAFPFSAQAFGGWAAHTVITQSVTMNPNLYPGYCIPSVQYRSGHVK